MITSSNLISAKVPDTESGEILEVLLARPGLLLERIVSRGCPTPEGQWYDQDGDEWVMLATGSAVLEIEGQAAVELQAGDWLLLAAHVRHRVEQVSSDAVWLALHLPPEAGARD
jgi:cupin 2 domain-containing protein